MLGVVGGRCGLRAEALLQVADLLVEDALRGFVFGFGAVDFGAEAVVEVFGIRELAFEV